MFGIEFFVAFGMGMLISGGATALYYSREWLKEVFRGILQWLHCMLKNLAHILYSYIYSRISWIVSIAQSHFIRKKNNCFRFKENYVVYIDLLYSNLEKSIIQSLKVFDIIFMILDMTIGMILGMAASPIMMKGLKVIRERRKVNRILQEISQLQKNGELSKLQQQQIL
jgi:hypothetical protein